MRMGIGRACKRVGSYMLVWALVGSVLVGGAMQRTALAANVSLNGRVTGGTQNTPIEGVEVEAVSPETNATVADDTTDANGQYEITLQEGTYNIRLTPPDQSGYQPSAINGVVFASDKTLNVALVTLPPNPDEFTYSGTIRDRSGTPLVGAAVQIEGAAGRFIGFTNASGHYTLTAPEGQYWYHQLFYKEINMSNQEVDHDAMVLNANTTQDFVIPAARLTINVVDPDGNPVNGEDADPNRSTYHDISLSQRNVEAVEVGMPHAFKANFTTSDATPGNSVNLYVLEDWPISELNVRHQLSQFVSYRRTNIPGIQGDTVYAAELERQAPFHEISGTILDDQGRPLPRAGISIQGSKGQFGTAANAQGEYTLRVPEGEYWYRRISASEGISFDDNEVEHETLNLNANRVENYKLPVAKLTVHMRDQQGNAVTGSGAGPNKYFDSTATQQGEDIDIGLAHNFKVSVHEPYATDGSELIMYLVKGQPFNLRVNHAYSTYKQYFKTNLPAIAQDTTIDGVLEPAIQRRVVSGYVRDQNGEPLTGFGVTIGSMGHGFSDVTDANGFYSVEAPVGTPYHRLRLTYNEIDVDNFSVELDEERYLQEDSQLNLTFPVTRLTVVATDPDGNPVGPNEPNHDYTETLLRQSVANIQVAPGIKVEGRLLDNQVKQGTDSPVFSVVPGHPMQQLTLNAHNTEYKPITLTNIAAVTEDTTLHIQLQRSQPPTVPLNVRAESPTTLQPVVMWDAATRATSYKVFRGDQEVASLNSLAFTDDLEENGTYQYRVRACNEAGCSALSQPVTVIYDSNGPILGTAVLGANPIPVGSSATLRVPASDDLSEVVYGEYFVGEDPGQNQAVAMTLVDGELRTTVGANLPLGEHAITIRARDSLGNWSPINTVTIQVVDVTPPVVGHSLSPLANANGWHNTNVTINWLPSDPSPSSGTPTDPANTLATTEGVSVNYTSDPSCDPAGNCATGSVALSIDKNPPVQSNLTAALVVHPVLMPTTRNFTITATDVRSGVQRVEYYLDNNDPGRGNATALTVQSGATYRGQLPSSIPGLPNHTLRVRTQDRAGNWSPVLSRSFIMALL